MTDTPVSNDKINGTELDATIDTPSSNIEVDNTLLSQDALKDSQEHSAKIKAIFDQSSTIIDVEKVNKSLKEVEETQKGVSEIKTLINSIIDNMAKNQSMLTRAALLWGKVPLWQKIGLGTVLIAPTLILGIALQIYMLIAISALTLIAYIPSSVVLDNHYNHDEQITDRLKESMEGLAQSLVNLIHTMEHLSVQLAGEIEQFQQENERLTDAISDLSEQVSKLTNEAVELQKTEQELRSIQQSLEQTDQELKLTLEEKTKLYEQIKTEINKVTLAFEKNQRELSQKTLELNRVQRDMGQQLNNLNGVAQSLQKVVETYADQIIKNEQDRTIFQSRLTEFVTNREKSFEEVAKRIEKRNEELLIVQNKFNGLQEEYQALLKRQGNEIQRLEQEIPANKSSKTVSVKPNNGQTEEKPSKHAHHIKNLGLHAEKKKHRSRHHHPIESTEVNPATSNGR
ncbi:LegC2/C7 family Dot/Icm T4SS effector [Legionella bononiensis]|uniref:Microtubule binding protein n=1 Tax=Legionella bononiensis TaxID=2793102 RepID=A0ABS1WD32_9GAMM|nr:LegC2/C7 family Dot/Icm T4SS effector [Legionella bononiensis]MBL7479135.1 hypothetical protein [Legionella bononiensis]MBL7527268.1 hypothetical protein [Legionella bononiensis]MBL7562237.1 hypothetical protein [Legionella bononiensis]